MTILSNLANSISYKINQAVYNPEAEKFAKEKEASAEAEKSKAEAEAKQKKETAQEKAKREKEAKEAEAAKKKLEERSTFSIGRLIGRIFGTAAQVLLILLIIGVGILGASLATNLNLYREWPYRILYLIYGFFFSPLVIVYVYIYRWLIKGKRPRFYSLMPLVPYKFENKYAYALFGWFSYKPDDLIDSQMEWVKQATESEQHKQH